MESANYWCFKLKQKYSDARDATDSRLLETGQITQPLAPSRPERVESFSRPHTSRLHPRPQIQHAAAAAPRRRTAHTAGHDVQLLLHELTAVRIGRHDRLQGVRALRVARQEPRVGRGGAAAPETETALSGGVDAALPARELRDRPLLRDPTQPHKRGPGERRHSDLRGPD